MDSTFKFHPSITVYRGSKGTGHYVWSPFVTKLEARLRFGRLSYNCAAGSPREAPRGKIPYMSISTGEEPPEILVDSTLIITKLIENGFLKDLNADFLPPQRVTDLALRALLEDKLYFYQTYERWIRNYYTMRPHVLSALPYPMQVIVGMIAYRSVSATLHGQGTMRLSNEEIGTLREEVWENINILLEGSRGRMEAVDSGSIFWLLGGIGPSEADATLFGFIVANLVCDAAPESRNVIQRYPVLVEYAQRIHDCYFPDYSLWK